MSTTDPVPAPAGAPGHPARVVLFGRAGCHLCTEARALVAEVCAETGEAWTEIDVDAPDVPALPSGRSVFDEYSELVPVVEVDGIRQGYWRIDAARLRRALAAGAPGSAAPSGPSGAAS
ncbi:glutaredoxin family protein [Cellulomonas sp. WB94]|uniref:glutaredoxin family protein n=1 Tax=Cellulomonas sp. WB94 TaxID=2173174 RepID=UPI000D57525B|nr:glutaredoxin family protein [Cellulomonas sp. WB94]PVU82480.1 glutaredoxin family protein [Cellulomonas sp. WB94]